MRWKQKERREPKQGDRRSKSGYLYVPKAIKGETRWREYAEWEEKYVGYYDLWEAEKWLN